VTGSGTVFGTPSYMAPEQTVDAHALDHRADVYALGAILCECLTGRPPFQAATVLDTLDQVRHRPPVPVRQLQPGVPPRLETICLTCLAGELPGFCSSLSNPVNFCPRPVILALTLSDRYLGRPGGHPLRHRTCRVAGSASG
jgi:serine/threonine protein kinase